MGSGVAPRGTSYRTHEGRPSRILFLDVDGVLHPGPNVPTLLTHMCWLPQLERLLTGHSDVAVVVHSTWRYRYELAELRELFGNLGARVIDVAPDGERYDSIRQWVSWHQGPGLTYRILDDEAGEFPIPPPAELILCDTRRGLGDPAVQAKLRDWLRKKETQ